MLLIDKNSKFSIHDMLKEDKRRMDHFISIKSRQLTLSKRKSEAAKPKTTTQDSDEDYYDVQTHAIDNYKLCEQQRKADQIKREQKIAEENRKQLQNMTEHQKEIELNNIFRKDFSKLKQFEKDEYEFSAQYRRNINKMYDRLKANQIHLTKKQSKKTGKMVWKNGKFVDAVTLSPHEKSDGCCSCHQIRKKHVRMQDENLD